MNYLVDASALHRLEKAAVMSVLGPLVEAGRVNLCAVTGLEVLFSARGLADYEQALERFRTGFAWPLSWTSQTPTPKTRSSDF